MLIHNTQSCLLNNDRLTWGLDKCSLPLACIVLSYCALIIPTIHSCIVVLLQASDWLRSVRTFISLNADGLCINTDWLADQSQAHRPSLRQVTRLQTPRNRAQWGIYRKGMLRNFGPNLWFVMNWICRFLLFHGYCISKHTNLHCYSMRNRTLWWLWQVCLCYLHALILMLSGLSGVSSWAWRGSAPMVWSASRPRWRPSCTAAFLTQIYGRRRSRSSPPKRLPSSTMVTPSTQEKPSASSLPQLKMWPLCVSSNDLPGGVEQNSLMIKHLQQCWSTLTLDAWNLETFCFFSFICITFALKQQRISTIIACKKSFVKTDLNMC